MKPGSPEELIPVGFEALHHNKIELKLDFFRVPIPLDMVLSIDIYGFKHRYIPCPVLIFTL